jgi:hypothetical protein
MAVKQALSAIALLSACVAAWTSTNYYSPTLTMGFYDVTSTTTQQSVYPTGSVIGTLTNSSTLNFIDEGVIFGSGRARATYVITITNIYLGPSASVCDTTSDYLFIGSEYKTPCPVHSSTTISTSSVDPATPTVSTRYFAPLIMANPSSCTMTSFSYTSSALIAPDSVFTRAYATFLEQLVEPGVILLSTTNVFTLSTNLGGQAVTTSVCDIYVGSGVAVVDMNYAQSSYLSQCVDPSSFLCATSYSTPDLSGCGQMPITYPPSGHAVTGGPTSPTTSTTSGACSIVTSVSWALALSLAILSVILLL